MELCFRKFQLLLCFFSPPISISHFVKKIKIILFVDEKS